MDVKNNGGTETTDMTTEKKPSLIRNFFYHLNGIFTLIFVTISTCTFFGPLMVLAFLKVLIPIKFFRKIMTIGLNAIAVIWISINNLNLKITKSITWEVEGLEGLSLNEWYLVISNHQSWSDILVLQKIFNRKIPFLKFFLKKELIKVPLLGVAWWALDFPFMKRYTSEFIKKNPHLKGKDIEITKKACEKFKYTPVSVMNFVEGTRFTEEKHKKKNSPFKNLLTPRAGGIGFVLSAMGEYLTKIINVTIMYPEGNRSFWDFLCGKVHYVKVIIETMPVTEEILGDYVEDKEYQDRFKKWLNDLWVEKDKKFN